MSRSLLVAVLLLPALLLGACGPRQEPTLPPRDDTPEAAEADLAALVAGNTAFAFDLYRALRAADGNLFYSPYSISLALGMTSAGARGRTLEQMRSALHFTLPDERLHAAFHALDRDLAARPDQARAAGAEQPLAFHSVNALWGQQGYPFLPDFLDLLARYYGAGLRLANFQTAAARARAEINAWVADQTGGRIEELIPPGLLNSSTVLVLVNAVYFKAGWLHPFSESRTAPAPFHLLDGSRVDVPMMAMNEPVPLAYAAGDGYQAFALPYQGGQTEMVVILPDAGRFADVEAGLSGEEFARMRSAMEERTIALRMPKFEFTADYELTDAFRALGLTDAFEPGRADLSGMAGTRELVISAILHKAFVAVDEQGTEAAAATAVVVARTALVIPEVEITVDRPFIFVIRDVPTGTVLFVGRVVDGGR